jgi:hypothetical protein
LKFYFSVVCFSSHESQLKKKKKKKKKFICLSSFGREEDNAKKLVTLVIWRKREINSPNNYFCLSLDSLFFIFIFKKNLGGLNGASV